MGLAERMSGVLEHLIRHDVFHLGPVVITSTVVHTWIIMVVLFVVVFLFTRGLRAAAYSDEPTPRRALLELAVEGFYGLTDPVLGVEGRKYVPFIGTYFIFILFMNLSWFIPDMVPPTSDIMTTAALAIVGIVFVIASGIRAQGLGPYLHHFTQPLPFMLPLNIVEELVRPFSLAVRLFGNIFGGKMVVLVFGMLAPLVLPIPIMGLEVLFGTIQAFVFALLLVTYLQGAIHGH
ncbi:MAG TPA: F0F1 ATP synthase subunit A [Limnochordia bacterium]